MSNILTFGILLLNVILVVILLISLHKISSVYRHISDIISTFLAPSAPGKTSPAADLVEAGSAILSRALVAQAKATFMGVQSVKNRLESGVEGALSEDLISAAHPLAGALLKSFPAVRGYLKKNPGIIDFALSKLTDKLGSTGQSPPVSGNGNRQMDFKL